jgi:hypothetical protein
VKVKKVIAYCLLLSFFVVLTPRSFWHDCDHHHSSNQKETVVKEKDCFACDFSLGIIDQPQQFNYRFNKSYFAKFDLTIASLYFKKKFEQFSHRGPPIS